uniref:F-box/WD repeat-containing protein 2 pseudogene n=1 Tax=Jaculus jaculus TaxID=51337 RepID=A0A8C5KII9_JACJA
MERNDFETWLDNISVTFLSLTDLQENETLDHLISLSGAVQLRLLSNNLETLLKRDFLKLLPLELSFYLLKWLYPQTLLTCCLVSKQWNKVISACTEVWQTACRNLGWQIDDSVQDTLHWKVYLKHFWGHTGVVVSVDYSDELDILVSGSAVFTVKIWALSTGTCLNTLTGHTEWVTKVVLQRCKVKSLLHSPGDYILLSADKYEIKIWPIGRETNCKCLKTLSVSEDRSICLQPRLHFDSKYIVCSSALGLYQVIKTPEVANLVLLGFGDVFALLFDNRYLYIMDLRTESLISCWPLPEYRKSKRGSSFLAGEASWLNGLDGHNDTGLVFATSMPDHSIHLVLWKEHG